jgi:hypothetical protein
VQAYLDSRIPVVLYAKDIRQVSIFKDLDLELDLSLCASIDQPYTQQHEAKLNGTMQLECPGIARLQAPRADARSEFMIICTQHGMNE